MNFDHILPENVQVVSDRQELITGYCKGKNVLHLGCADAGLTEEAIKIGNFLQSKIAKVANFVIGIDNDLKGLEIMEQYKNNNERYLHLNIENINSSVIKDDIDIIIAGELLEHMSCPGKFLENIHSFMHVKNAKMMLTVPNAFNLRHMFGIWDGKEYVHPDHNYYFSYFTIKHFCDKYKLSIEKAYTYYSSPKIVRTKALIPLRQFFRKAFCDHIIRKAPFFADGLVFILKAG